MESTAVMKYESRARSMRSKFGPQFDVMNAIRESNARPILNMYEEVYVGQYMENWQVMSDMMLEDATTRDTIGGGVLRSNIGLVALQYATLPITEFASVQVLDDEAGVIFYRNLVATATRGGVTEGDIITKPSGLSVADPTYYSEEQVIDNVVPAEVAGKRTITLTLSGPVRQRFMTVDIKNGTFKGMDDGEGHIIGNNMNGTINYGTGDLVLDIIDVSGIVDTDTYTIIYMQNLAQSSVVPGFKWDLQPKIAFANYYLIQGEYSQFASYTVRKRFGRMLEDDAVIDSVNQINSAVMINTVKKLRLAAIKHKTINWDATVVGTASVIEHRATFYDALELAATAIADDAGNGGISFIIAGQKGRVVLRSLGFTASVATSNAPYLAGYIDGIPVYYAPSSVILPDEVIVGYRGSSWFEAPIVYAPFMPLTTVRGNVSLNIFNQAVGTAHSAAIEPVVSDYVVRIKILNM